MSANGTILSKAEDNLLQLNLDLKNLQRHNVYAKHHGDRLLGDRKYLSAGTMEDLKRVLTLKNAPVVADVLKKFISTRQLDMKAAAPLVGSLPNNSTNRKALVDKQVKLKYDRMLHPPLTYLGDAFQYRTADGKFNSALHPHLGQAGAPYAKTVPAKTHQLGAMPDPGDLFDKLMARQGSRPSQSGLSSMLIYHATIIIHDVFRTNDNDKNISDSSSYLDLSPLYGYTDEMQRKVRDGRYRLGLLKPDVFAEDRLLRQPPGVCILLVMYNRYHNYAATQLRRINENGRFKVPDKYARTQLVATAQNFCPTEKQDNAFVQVCRNYETAWKTYEQTAPPSNKDAAEDWRKIYRLRERVPPTDKPNPITYEYCVAEEDKIKQAAKQKIEDFKHSKETAELEKWRKMLEGYIPDKHRDSNERKAFVAAYDAAWTKLDDDLFNTARLITCGMYIQVSIHDYLRALMGFHQFDTDFTLEPRDEIDHKNVSRGIGNQVTVEFNLLYRFHCAISARDEKYTEDFMREKLKISDPQDLSLEGFIQIMKMAPNMEKKLGKVEPWYQEFGLEHVPKYNFERNPITGLFDDDQMVKVLVESMDDPISNFGPKNTPKCLRSVEIMGILQARKWGIGTLNDFREFFGMDRHDTFESITANVEIQDALRDLYEHPDKVELYPGVFCESDADMGVDPGPSDVSSALWAAIFSDAITLVRSDRFYTVDWNTHSLTSWGMKEVTADSEVLKSSVFHRLIQRAFPGWFPYNSVRFFHPFYTGETNAKFAEAQGYAADFKMKRAADTKSGQRKFDIDGSDPKKPVKPKYLTDYDQILDVLDDKTYDFVHPALTDPYNFPPAVRGAIKAAIKIDGKRDGKKAPSSPPPQKESKPKVEADTAALQDYFTKLMQSILKRESIIMNSTTYQIDITRDFAIPVVARYIADFLGFGRLVDDKKNAKAQYTENEIYQHITNCQIFMSYNADETKFLKRRAEFRRSFEFLYEQTLDGNVAEAGKWSIFQRTRDNPMTELGYKVAERILQHEKTAERSALVLVFVALNAAHNGVLSFTSVMNLFINNLYDEAAANGSAAGSRWSEIQRLAFEDDDSSMKQLSALVQEADQESVQLPTVRIAQRDRVFNKWSVTAGELIILDLVKAPSSQRFTQIASVSGHVPEHAKKPAFLPFRPSATDEIAGYHPKDLAIMSLVGMVKFFAQMKNLRRGHHTQGKVKRVKIEPSAEGYFSFMAPMRLERVAAEAAALGDKGKGIYTSSVLEPESHTYMNAEWDEMLPFPTTWKLRFDGFGRSTYQTSGKDGRPVSLLHVPVLFDDAPPFYQPRGASHTGGTFADVACICNGPGTVCKCKGDSSMELSPARIGPDGLTPAQYEPTYSTGCGMTH